MKTLVKVSVLIEFEKSRLDLLQKRNLKQSGEVTQREEEEAESRMLRARNALSGFGLSISDIHNLAVSIDPNQSSQVIFIDTELMMLKTPVGGLSVVSYNLEKKNAITVDGFILGFE